jgi:predicted extracellular nuclease
MTSSFCFNLRNYFNLDLFSYDIGGTSNKNNAANTLKDW